MKKEREEKNLIDSWNWKKKEKKKKIKFVVDTMEKDEWKEGTRLDKLFRPWEMISRINR